MVECGVIERVTGRGAVVYGRVECDEVWCNAECSVRCVVECRGML